MTIGEIIAEITKEIGGDSVDSMLSSNLLSFCTAALRRIPKRVRDRSLITIGTATLSSGAQTASNPSNMLKERMVWRLDSGKRIEIEKAHFRSFNLDWFNSSSSGSPSKYRIYGSTLEFDVKADKDYTIYVEYFKKLTTSGVAASDEFALPEDCVEPFKDLVKSYYYEYQDDDARGAGLFKRGYAVFQDIDDEFIDEELGDNIEST